MPSKHRSIYPWRLAVAVVAGALILAWAVWPRDVQRSKEPPPTLAATTLPPADRPRILVADFEDRSEGPRTGRPPEEDIYQALVDRVRANGLALHVARTNEVADEFSAAYMGRTNNTTLVVWGWYDDIHIQAHVEQIEAPPVRLSNLPLCALDDPSTQIPHLVLFVLAVHAHSQGRYAQALEYLNPATTREFECAVVHNQRGLAYQALDDHDAALIAFSQAIALEPENAGFYANRGETFEAMEQYHAAHADFARAWELTRNLATLFN